MTGITGETVTMAVLFPRYITNCNAELLYFRRPSCQMARRGLQPGRVSKIRGGQLGLHKDLQKYIDRASIQPQDIHTFPLRGGIVLL